MKSGWAYCFACLALVCVGCIPPRLTATDAAPPDAAPPEAAPPDAGSEAAPDAAAETRIEGGQLKRSVMADVNDALWVHGDDERLHYAADQLTTEVGNDAEMARTGLRFDVSVPRGATITSARIGLLSENTHTDQASTMLVRIYDSVDVPPFSDLHQHTAEQHDPGGLMGKAVDGFMVCGTGEVCASPDVSELVQRVVDKPQWTGTGWIGFVLEPDGDFGSSSWISFEDSSGTKTPPSLEIEYAPPP